MTRNRVENEYNHMDNRPPMVIKLLTSYSQGNFRSRVPLKPTAHPDAWHTIMTCLNMVGEELEVHALKRKDHWAVLDLIGEPVIQITPAGQIAWMNRSATSAFCGEQACPAEQHLDDLVKSPNVSVFSLVHHQLQQGDRMTLPPLVIHQAGGQEVPMTLSAVRLSGTGGIGRGSQPIVLHASIIPGQVKTGSAGPTARMLELPHLTPKEHHVLLLLLEERGRLDIAEQLRMSPKTVDVIRHDLLLKFKAKTILGLYRNAQALGLVA